MKYSFEKIGQRLFELRKGYKWSQEDLIEKLGEKGVSIGRNSLSSLEAGKLKHCDLRLFTALCELYDCELGYLLGEHEGKTRASTDIHEQTGLSYPAIDELTRMKEYNQWYALRGLNTLLEESVCLTLDNIGKYLADSRGYYIEAQDGTRIGTDTIHMIEVQQCLTRLKGKYQDK